MATDWHLPGRVPAATALRVLLTHAGVVTPGSRKPLSEAMVFGIAGGIGAGIFAFRYEKEDFSSFFIAGRHLWQDDLAYLKAACGRFGVQPRIKETIGAKGAKVQLAEAVARGPVIAWVDSANLPHRGMPAEASGGGYHVITVYQLDEAAGTALIGDLADDPIEIPLDALALARGRIAKQKNRILSFDPPKRSPDLAEAIREGLRACEEGLRKQRMQNFRLDAFKVWADRMHGSTVKDNWEQMFPPGHHLRRGLLAIYQYIEHYGTGGGLCRPIFAEFLAEASRVLDDARLGDLAARYAELGRGWSALAEAALPGDQDLFRRTRQAVARRAELLRSGAGEAEVRASQKALGDISKAADQAFPLDQAEAAALRAALKIRILKLYEGEVAAQHALAATRS